MTRLAKPHLLCCLLSIVALMPASLAAQDAPLRLLVMDPLAVQLACECIPGFAQRDYSALARVLEGGLGRPVEAVFAESIATGANRLGAHPDIVIGKRSVVAHDAEQAGLALRPLAALRDKDGATDFTGLFVVARDSRAKTLSDLAGLRVVFGPPAETEKHGAAVEALQAAGAAVPELRVTRPSDSAAALAVIDGEADAAVISSYALPLLEGCGTIDKGELRVVGRTAPVPFVTVFATGQLPDGRDAALLEALLSIGGDAELLTALESKLGFVALDAADTPPPGGEGENLRDWPDWRGPRRDGISPGVPDRLPGEAKFIWQTKLTSIGLAGVTVAGRRVLVTDKSEGMKDDIFLCLDAATGEVLWRLSYPAPDDMDYSNSPRAAPVVHDGLVYLLGAFGHLHCVKLASGEVVWKANICEDFGAEPLTWGACAAPLVVDGKLIVNPGADDASVVALDAKTGEVIWKTPGSAAAYASFIVGEFGGKRQIVGYDVQSLGGWDIATGQRLWTITPQYAGDFNVPTPINWGGKLIVTTENNGTRVYEFGADGTPGAEPVAQNDDLSHDTTSPVLIDGLVVGAAAGRLYCLDPADGLKTLWKLEDEGLWDHASLIGGNGRALITTQGGEILLVPITRGKPGEIQRLTLFEAAEIWSHPALAEGNLYVRNEEFAACLSLQ